MSGCEIHTTRVGMATALQVESSQRNRVSGVSRRSRARSCKSDAGMLVASTIAGKNRSRRASRGGAGAFGMRAHAERDDEELRRDHIAPAIKFKSGVPRRTTLQ